MDGEQDIGERFLDALLGRDFIDLAGHLHPRVHLRVLQPGGALVRMGAKPVIERCERWFSDWDRFTVLDRSSALVATRIHLAYHLVVSTSGDFREVAHEMFVDVIGKQINIIDLLDSGFLPLVRHADTKAPFGSEIRRPLG